MWAHHQVCAGQIEKKELVVNQTSQPRKISSVKEKF